MEGIRSNIQAITSSPKPEVRTWYTFYNYCILCGRIKGFNRSITTIMCEDGSYRTVVG